MYADWKEIIFTFALFKDRGVAQLASVLAWGARGRKFESSHPDLKINHLQTCFVGGFFFYTNICANIYYEFPQSPDFE